MANNVQQIAEKLGAKAVGQTLDVRGGAFGAARLARTVEQLQSRLTPGQGLRAGRPTVSGWERHPKVPMSRATEERLIRLAANASTDKRKVSPMQLAAQILEDALEAMAER